MSEGVRCPTCRELRELVEVPPAHGVAGGVRVELFGLRLLCCAVRDHPPAAPHPDFAADLMAGAAMGGAIPTAVTRGLWRRRRACGSCGADLAGLEDAPGSLRARVRVPRAAALTVSVEGPCVECPACYQRQLPGTPQAVAALERALLAALADSGIPGEW